jgi:hypothetical protein
VFSLVRSESLIARVLGDISGFATLATFVSLVSFFIFRSVRGTPMGVFLFIYVLLGLPGYLYWVKTGKGEAQPQWLLQALQSIVVGTASCIVDVVVGYWLHKPKSIMAAAASTNVLFGLTLLVCPGFTAVAFAGWIRSLVIQGATVRN